MSLFIPIQALGITLASISVYAMGIDVSALPPHDQVLAWMQAAGFPAWAGVVAWGVMRVTAMIKELSTRLDKFISTTEKRITRIEMYLAIKAPIDHATLFKEEGE
jgi:hypothetical protein